LPKILADLEGFDIEGLRRQWRNHLGGVAPVHRPKSLAPSRGTIVLFCRLGNHVDLRGLPGGGRSPAKPVCVPFVTIVGKTG